MCMTLIIQKLSADMFEAYKVRMKQTCTSSVLEAADRVIVPAANTASSGGAWQASCRNSPSVLGPLPLHMWIIFVLEDARRWCTLPQSRMYSAYIHSLPEQQRGPRPVPREQRFGGCLSVSPQLGECYDPSDPISSAPRGDT